MANTVPGTEAMDEEDRVGAGARSKGVSLPGRLGPSQEGEGGQTVLPSATARRASSPRVPGSRLPAFHTSLTVCPTEMFCFSGI